MRRIFLAGFVLASLLPAPLARAAAGPHLPSPPGQLHVVTVNAAQNKVIGTHRFRMLLNLTEALLNRPAAFNGGAANAGSAPDVIILQEISASNLDILEKLLQQRSDFRYDIAGSIDSRPKFLINADRIAVEGEPTLWDDPCYADTMSAQSHEPPASLPERVYQSVRLVENDTGTPFAVAGVHFSKKYAETGQERCFERNVEELRTQLEPVAALPTIIGGDFNRRPTEPQPQCDRDERGTPMEWWSMMTAPATGVAYADTAQAWNRSRGVTMHDQWTHVHRLHHISCGAQYMQHRLDYLFAANVTIASAAADHPGWAGEEPGSRSTTNPYYSDHRFVAGRYQIAGPEQAPRPVATQLAGGRIALTWTNPEVPPSQWILYRAIGGGAYTELMNLPGGTVAYDDYATEHGRNYRYALAAVDAAGAQGIESKPAWMRADSRGPQLKGTTPRSGGTGVDRRTNIYARFDEHVDPTSVSASTIDMYRNGKSVCGRVEQVKRGIVMFDPCNALAKKKEYRAVVRPVRDLLGNRGTTYSWSFVTR